MRFSPALLVKIFVDGRGEAPTIDYFLLSICDPRLFILGG